MGTSKLFSKNKLNPVKGALIELDSISKFKTVTKTMPLKDLVALKLKTVERIKSLTQTLLSKRVLNLAEIQGIVEKIEALQYNLTVFKQLNAIANVGNPAENMYGINSCIYQSSDLNTLNHTLSSLASKTFTDKDRDTPNLRKIREFLYDKIEANKAIVGNLYRIQTEYNKKIKVTVEYLDVK